MSNSGAGKWAAVIVGGVVALVLIAFSIYTTVTFTRNLLPAYGVGIAVCAVAAVDIGTLSFAMAFVYDADSFLRQAIAALMVVGNFVANFVVMTSNFVLFGGQGLIYPAWLPWVVTVGFAAWFMVNIGAGLAYWMASPKVQSRIVETTAQAKLQSARQRLALQKLESEIGRIANAQSKTFADGFISAQMEGHGQAWRTVEPTALPSNSGDNTSVENTAPMLEGESEAGAIIATLEKISLRLDKLDADKGKKGKKKRKKKRKNKQSPKWLDSILDTSPDPPEIVVASNGHAPKK